MKNKTIITVGVLISIIGFILAVISVVIETHIHKDIRDNDSNSLEYKELLFKKSMVNSFGEIGIFLGFLTMNFVVLRHLWEQF